MLTFLINSAHLGLKKCRKSCKFIEIYSNRWILDRNPATVAVTTSEGRSKQLFFTAVWQHRMPITMIFTSNLRVACFWSSSRTPQTYGSVRSCHKKLRSPATPKLSNAPKPIVFLGAVLKKSKKHQAISLLSLKCATLPSKTQHWTSLITVKLPCQMINRATTVHLDKWLTSSKGRNKQQRLK